MPPALLLQLNHLLFHDLYLNHSFVFYLIPFQYRLYFQVTLLRLKYHQHHAHKHEQFDGLKQRKLSMLRGQASPK